MVVHFSVCEDAWARDLFQVRAMSFNIRTSGAGDGPNHWAKRKEMVCRVIRQFGGDFVGLQEVQPDQAVYVRRALPEYRYLGRTRQADPDEGEAVPLLYRHARWKLDATEHGTFWLSKTPDVPGSKSWWNVCPRIVTWGRFLETTTGGAVYVYNVHFSHISEQSRRKSAALLAARIAARRRREPVIVLGDFNAGEASYPIRYLKGDSSNGPVRLVDTFRAVHSQAPDAGTFNGFRGTRTGAKIDYVLTAPTARVLAARILRYREEGKFPSDHFPVTATIAFPLTTTTTTTTAD
jgi:endonuclease/exonuclease/phosphatase family metal-dependent hydrolase